MSHTISILYGCRMNLITSAKRSKDSVTPSHLNDSYYRHKLRI